MSLVIINLVFKVAYIEKLDDFVCGILESSLEHLILQLQIVHYYLILVIENEYIILVEVNILDSSLVSIFS